MTATETSFASKLETIFTTTIGLALTPLVAIVSPRLVMSFLDMDQRTIDIEANRAYFDSVRGEAPDAERAAKAATGQLQDLADANDWAGVSALLAGWEAERKTLPNDLRYAELGLDFLRHHLADHVYAPTFCNYEPYYEISDGALARVEAVAAAHPGDPILNAFLAQLHIDRGWCARGGGWSGDVTEDGWEGLSRSFETAAQILARFDPRETRSPFVARVAFQLLAAMDATIGEAREMYRAWSDPDIANPAPHMAYAFYVMPRWFGSWPELEAEARAASERTASATGDTAYALFYMTALRYEDTALEVMDMELFAKGLDDLCRISDNPAHEALQVIARLAGETDPGLVPIWDEVLKRGLLRRREALRDILRGLAETHVTALATGERGGFEKTALEALSALYQKDLKAGKHLDFTPEGIRVVTPEEAG